MLNSVVALVLAQSAHDHSGHNHASMPSSMKDRADWVQSAYSAGKVRLREIEALDHTQSSAWLAVTPVAGSSHWLDA